MFRFETRLFEIWGKLQTLPPSKISDILRVGGRTVISGVPNVGGIDFGREHGCLGAHGLWMLLGGGWDWRLGEVTNLPRFRPLDIGPIGYTGQSQDSNFLPPKHWSRAVSGDQRPIWCFVQYLGEEALTFSVLLNWTFRICQTSQIFTLENPKAMIILE